MTLATLIRDATADGVELRIVGGALKASGDREAVNRWLPIIREHKPELLRLLAANEPTDPEPDRGPNFDDLDHPEGRAAGERIYQALLMPSPVSISRGRLSPSRTDDRRHCRDCQSLRRGVCTEATRIGAREGYQPVDDVPRRCEGFRPGRETVQ